MKYLFLIFSILFATAPAYAALSLPPVDSPVSTAGQQLTSESLSRQAVEARLGRKLKFTERVGLSVARGKMKRSERRAAKKAKGAAPVDGFAVVSAGLTIIGIALFVILLGEITAILFPLLLGLMAGVFGLISLGRFKRNPQLRSGKGLAIAGLVMGGVVMLVLLLSLVAIAFDPNRAG